MSCIYWHERERETQRERERDNISNKSPISLLVVRRYPLEEMDITMDNNPTAPYNTASNNNKAVPAPFLTKTYQLVDDPCTDHIVSWGDNDTTFVVWRPPEFAREILPNYFKHNNFSSFVRQLNTYVRTQSVFFFF